MTSNRKPVKTVKAHNSSLFSSVSQPSIRETITLHSASAQKIMEREFNRLASSFFYLDVSMLYAGDTKIIEEYRAATDIAYTQLKQEIQTAVHNTKKLAEKNNITGAVSYQHVKQYDVEITNPRSMEFLQLILLFDELIKSVDTVWIRNEALVGGSKKRLEHHQEWQRRIIRFIQEIIRFQLEQLRLRRKKDNEKKREAEAKNATAIQQPINPNTSPTVEQPSKKGEEAKVVSTDLDSEEELPKPQESSIVVLEPTHSTNSVTA